MKMKTLLEKFSYFFESAVVTLIAAFFVTSVVYAATTIGANINTGGNLDVDGNSSTTNATTTGYLYVGVGITNPPGFDFGQGDLLVSNDFYVNSQATTSASLWVGSAGTTNYLSMTGGDLYVADDVEIDGSATTTTLYLSNVLAVDFTASTTDLIVSDDLIVHNQATTSASLWVGSAGTTNYLSMTGGDLYVADDVEIDGSATTTSLYLSNDLTVVGNSTTTGDVFVNGGTLALATGTPTTTAGLFVSESGTTSTTTVGIGTQRINGCLEFVAQGAFIRVYPTFDGSTRSLVVEAGRCN